MRLNRTSTQFLAPLIVLLLCDLACRGWRTDRRANSDSGAIKPHAGSEGTPQDIAPNGEPNSEDVNFMLQAKHSELCLNASSEAITQRACRSEAVNLWKFVTLPSGSLQISSQANGSCLSVAQGSRTDGSAAVTAPCNPSDTAQAWVSASEADGSFALKLVDSELCLDVESKSKAEGGQIIVWKCLGTANQNFLKKSPDADTAKPGKPTFDPTALTPFALDCASTPKFEVISQGKHSWDIVMYGGNYWYFGFFSPVAAVADTVYWVWIDADETVKVSAIANGQERTVDLATKYRARENVHNMYSLGVDAEGYIHISGDMQNGPNESAAHIAGRSGYYPAEYVGAPILYWKSKEPYNIEQGFEFLGKSSNAIPATDVNGIRFFSSGRGELFAQTASNASDAGHAPGEKGVGLYRYDLTRKVWVALGATPEGKDRPVVFWDVGGVADAGWFQGLFTYLRFDSKDVMHFAGSINTNTSLDWHNNLVYAKSEDYGVTWKRADGSTIAKLPIRALGDSSQRGDVISTEKALDWQSSVAIDGTGKPAILQRIWNDSEIWYSYEGSTWTTDNKLNEHTKNRPQFGYTGPGNNVILVRSQKPITLFCQQTFDKPEGEFVVDGYDNLTNVDEMALRREGVVYAVAINRAKSAQSLVKITYKRAP